MGWLYRSRLFRFEAIEGEEDARSTQQHAEEEARQQSAGSRVELRDN